MKSRRDFLKIGTMTGAGLFLPLKGLVKRVFAQIPGGMLPPGDIPKYMTPLVIPPAMPRTGMMKGMIDYYTIAVRQFQQRILPSPMPMTTVWSYGSATDRRTFNYPAFTIEAKVNRPVRVKWINDLKDSQGNFLPHVLPVDPTLHWANPPGGTMGRDMCMTRATTRWPTPRGAAPGARATRMGGLSSAQPMPVASAA